MKIAIFHDYFRVMGGAEKLVLMLAQELHADIITSEADLESVKIAGINTCPDSGGVRVITLGRPSSSADMAPLISRRRFSECDFSKQYDFFIFSGTFSIYAGKRHTPNMWYCHSPLRGLYDLKKQKHVDSEIVVADSGSK